MGRRKIFHPLHEMMKLRSRRPSAPRSRSRKWGYDIKKRQDWVSGGWRGGVTFARCDCVCVNMKAVRGWENLSGKGRVRGRARAGKSFLLFSVFMLSLPCPPPVRFCVMPGVGVFLVVHGWWVFPSPYFGGGESGAGAGARLLIISEATMYWRMSDTVRAHIHAPLSFSQRPQIPSSPEPPSSAAPCLLRYQKVLSPPIGRRGRQRMPLEAIASLTHAPSNNGASGLSRHTIFLHRQIKAATVHALPDVSTAEALLPANPRARRGRGVNQDSALPGDDAVL